jgi:hypothetical protein
MGSTDEDDPAGGEVSEPELACATAANDKSVIVLTTADMLILLIARQSRGAANFTRTQQTAAVRTAAKPILISSSLFLLVARAANPFDRLMKCRRCSYRAPSLFDTSRASCVRQRDYFINVV